MKRVTGDLGKPWAGGSLNSERICRLISLTIKVSYI